MTAAVNLSEHRRPRLTIVPSSTAGELGEAWQRLLLEYVCCPTPDRLWRVGEAYLRWAGARR